MEELNEFQKDMLKTIAVYYPCSFNAVKEVFIACGYSFDKTIIAIEFALMGGLSMFETAIAIRTIGK